MHLQTDVVTEEIPLATILKNAQPRSATAAMKEQRARDAALAMRDYETEKLAIHANTARLSTPLGDGSRQHKNTNSHSAADQDG